VGKKGNVARYSEFILRRYGVSHISKLIEQDDTEIHYKEEDYAEIEAKYTKKAEKLKSLIDGY